MNLNKKYIKTSLILMSLIGCNIYDIEKPNSPINDVLKNPRVSCPNLNNNELPEQMWKSEFIDNVIAGSIKPVVSEEAVVVSRSADFHPPDELLCFSKSKGENLWSWSEYFGQNEILSDFEPYYIENNLMYLVTFGSIYIIELQSGKTNYRQNFGNLNYIGSYGDKNLISITYSTDTSKEAAVFNTENNKLINCASYPKNSKYKGSFSLPYIVDKTCYFSFNFYHINENKDTSILYRVDLIDNIPVIKWKKYIPGIGIIGNFGYQVLGNRLYVIDRDLYCINTEDGSIIWQQPNIFGGPGGLIIADYKLIVASNHLNPSLYAFDLITGEILWSEPLSGSASPLQYNRCVIYTVGGGDGLLHAVDVSSGKHIYKMDSPDVAQNSNLYFDNCTVDPTTNSIFLTNFRYLMRYRLPEY